MTERRTRHRDLLDRHCWSVCRIDAISDFFLVGEVERRKPTFVTDERYLSSTFDAFIILRKRNGGIASNMRPFLAVITRNSLAGFRHILATGNA